MAQYKAIDEFRANLDGGANPVLVKRGTVFTYDGVYIEVMGSDGVIKKGSVPMLKSQLGEWYVEVEGTDIQASAASQVAPVQAAPQAGRRVYTPEEIAAAQAIVNSSAIGDSSLKDMINKYDNPPNLNNLPNLRDRKSPTVINDDASIVAQVRKTAGESKTVNTSGVQIENSEIGKRAVVSHEERMVKKTNYSDNPTIESSEPKRKKLFVVSDSEGVVVRKTSEKAIFKTEIHETKNIDKSTGQTVSKEGEVVKTASYPKAEGVDVGSSTLTQTVVKTDAEKKAAIAKAAAAKASRMKQVVGDQDGVVVAKVRKDEAPKNTADGFTATLKVGGDKSGSEDSIDGIIGGKAVISDGGINDSIIGEEAVVSRGGNDSISDSDGATIIESDTDVEINDILSEM